MTDKFVMVPVELLTRLAALQNSDLGDDDLVRLENLTNDPAAMLSAAPPAIAAGPVVTDEVVPVAWVRIKNNRYEVSIGAASAWQRLSRPLGIGWALLLYIRPCE